MVTSHCIENDLARQLRLMLRLTSHKLTLALFYLHHFATFVVAAFGANAVWHAGLTTIGTQCRLGDAQSIVRAPFVATSFGMSSFGIWHNYSVVNVATKKHKKPLIHCAFCAFLWLS
jgi:hypothetical protein